GPDVHFVGKRAQLVQQHGDAVGLLPGGAPGRPDAELAPLLARPHEQLGEHPPLERRELARVAEELGVPHRDQGHERPQLVLTAGTAQALHVLGDRGEAQRLEARRGGKAQSVVTLGADPQARALEQKPGEQGQGRGLGGGAHVSRSNVWARLSTPSSPFTRYASAPASSPRRLSSGEASEERITTGRRARSALPFRRRVSAKPSSLGICTSVRMRSYSSASAMA